MQYAWFFHRSVGIGIGAWLSNCTSYGKLSGEYVFCGLKQVNGLYVPDTESGIIDSDGEYYNHHANVRRWRERQTIHTVGVPVSLQFQAWGKQGKTGLFAALGVAPVYSVYNTYRLLEGEIEHWGAYLHMNIHDVKEFGTIDYVAGTITQRGQTCPYPSAGVHPDGKLSVNQFSVTALADLGLLIRLSPQVDLLLGAYAHYTNLGWQAGGKIGVHWHSLAKPRTESVLRNERRCSW